jgi:hypothetical protein
MTAYPSSFPAPRCAPHSWTVDMGVLRTQMDGGNARQRRLYDVMPSSWQLEFAVELAQLFEWQAWVNANAYDYFDLPLVSWLSSQAGQRAMLTEARFTSDLQIEFAGPDNVVVRVAAELSPAAVPAT